MKTDLAISHLIQTRKNMISLLDKRVKNLEVIPNGFNNSLLWNAAHCLVTLQLLVYKLSGNEIQIDSKYIDKYKKGTFASTENNIALEELKHLLIHTAIQLEKDYKKGLFTRYHQYETSYGVQLNSVEDAILFNNIHEGVHFGYMMAIVKSIA